MQAHWLTAERVRTYSRLFLALYLLMGLVWLYRSEGMVSGGKPLGGDFIAFWSASWLALQGHAADAYQVARIVEAHKLVAPTLDTINLWPYPPTFFLLIWPLALLPYPLAYWLFMLLTFAALATVIHHIAPRRDTWVLLLAFSGVFINAINGQNGFLTTALLGMGLLWLTPRPLLAGICFGLLSFKPHLGLLLPLALLCAGAWRSFITAAVVALLFLLLSTLALGGDTLTAFWQQLPLMRSITEQGLLPLFKMPTAFAAARLLGFETGSAYALQAVISLLAALGVLWTWRTTASLPLRGAMLVVASLLASPYLFDYDLVLLALPLAWLGIEGMRTDWLPLERPLLVGIWCLPLFYPSIALATGLPLAPLLLLALFALIVRRVWLTTASATG